MRFFILLFLSIFFLGCQTSGNRSHDDGGGPGKLKKLPDETQLIQYSETIIILDDDLVDKLYYVDHRLQRFPSGQVRIQVNMLNRDISPQVRIEWKIIFYDGQNYKIEETEWYTTHFPQNEIRTIKGESIRPDVKNFTVVLRTPPAEKKKKW